MHDSRAVANSFLSMAQKAHDTMTPMQVLKLVYIAHGWMLGLYGRPLIKDRIEAWQYGPVIPRLYDEVRRFGSQPVAFPIGAAQESFTEQEADVIKQVYKLYGQKSGIELSRLTHQSGSPWDQTYEPGSFGLTISNDLIEDHYRQMAAAN